MNQQHYTALVVEENNGQFERSLQQRSLTELLAEPLTDELLIRVSYSSLNYKDALSSTGNKGVTRHYPHVPGIDAVGVVEQSSNGNFSAGDTVIVTGFDLGMDTDGGFAQYIRVPAAWALPLPAGLDQKQAMILGTAGLTAGLCVNHICNQLKPQSGPIVVSGASGGVGSLAVAMLAKLGYSVVAISGKDADFLHQLGAQDVISREEFNENNSRPLLKARFAGAVDTVGGTILANIIKSLKPWGVATLCGNAASPDLPLTVFPFILRGITVTGIDSQDCPLEERTQVWNKLANEWRPEQLLALYKEITLEQLEQNIQGILQGQLTGRTLINLNR
ncbi:YhdH/YhfP family quinone oxidoreductase [Porticoccus sp. W117]|uniref:YhdH/YhfP family quinone oxidoreductase n=1 Tax=Porticoccus sp. W117 TaxID=3054777 RepID=UPI002595AFE3|nr:YhdH/YhfP family quinone oxidoreductase [Porticoccus sp. W117]MDM3869930.1 YhdH/YhfP family quinone oxidoreductase [Porticoccus sp. W117]